MSKRVLITGVTSGIGRVVFEKALKRNYEITCVLRREEQRSLFADCPQEKVRLCIADLADKAQVELLSEELRDKSFDYILFNAGCSETGIFHKTTDESIERIMQANLLANMHLTHALLPKALEKKTRLVYVSSLMAHMPGINCASYATSKSALSHFVYSLRCMYPALPILCVEIGPVDTPLHAKVKNDISRHKKFFKSAEKIGGLLFDAMHAKRGLTTLQPEWTVLRKFMMTFEGLTRRIFQTQTYVVYPDKKS